LKEIGGMRPVTDPHGKPISAVNLEFRRALGEQPDVIFSILTGYLNVVVQAGFALCPGWAGRTAVDFSYDGPDTKGIRRRRANFIDL